MRGIAGCAIDGEVLHPEPFRRQLGARVRNWGKPRSANLPQGEHGRRGDKPCKLAKAPVNRTQRRVARERVAKGKSAPSIAQEWGVAHTTVARAVT